MTNIGIYKITSPTNKVYIGQSWNLKNRQRMYRQSHCSQQRKVHASITKYGWDAHKFEVVLNVSENISQDMFDSVEQTYMDYYRSEGFELMNIREAGAKGKPSQETLELMRVSQIGKVVSPEARQKMSAAKANIKQETRDKMSKSKKELWTNAEYRIKMTESKKKYVFTDAHKENLKKSARRGEANPQYGKRHPDEIIEKIRAANLGKKLSPEHLEKLRNGCRKKILQFTKENEFLREWNSIIEAAQSVGHKEGTAISACCRGESKSSAGFVWKYKTDN